LRIHDSFRRRVKLNPKEHTWLQKTSDDSAAYCDQTGKIISNQFLFSLNADVIKELLHEKNEHVSPKAGERTQTELPIKKVKLGEVEYGVVFGEHQFIISDDECIHYLYDNDEAANMRTGWKPRYETFDLNELRKRATVMDLAQWVHYWGIKDRMARNYWMLRKSMKEIGVSDETMPAFGD
jgi:hypothetical protein